MTPREALEKCVTLAGGQSELARRIGGRVKQAHVHYWLNEMKEISHRHVLACEAAVSGQVTRHQLRPDIYPKESRRRAA